jgi:GNAT superfamily N-acetyltransferase
MPEDTSTSERAFARTARIRPVAPGDEAGVWRLIAEFAAFVKHAEEATGTPEQLAAHLFRGAWPPLGGFVAEDDGRLVGYAIWFGTFSTFWTSPTLYLEDLYVSPSHRGTGAGLALFRAVAREAVARGCPRMHWSVLKWNAGAIEFYDRLGAERDATEHSYHLDRERLVSLAAEAGSGP